MRGDSVQRRAAGMSEFQTQVLTILDWPIPETYACLPAAALTPT